MLLAQERRRHVMFILQQCLQLIEDMHTPELLGCITDEHIDAVFSCAYEALHQLGHPRVRASNVRLGCSVQTGHQEP